MRWLVPAVLVLAACSPSPHIVDYADDSVSVTYDPASTPRWEAVMFAGGHCAMRGLNAAFQDQSTEDDWIILDYKCVEDADANLGIREAPQPDGSD